MDRMAHIGPRKAQDARTCVRCTGRLNSYNPGPLCGPCGLKPGKDGKTPYARMSRFARLLRGQGWREKAACKNKPTYWWYPDNGPDARGLTAPRTQSALRLCALCPVRRECLSDAMNEDGWLDLGIRGGVDETTRLKARHVCPPGSMTNRRTCRGECVTDMEAVVERLLKEAQERAVKMGLISEGEMVA